MNYHPHTNFPRHLLHRYVIEQQIGQGAYGSVWKGYCRQTRQPVAIKGFFNIFKDHVDAKRILREVSMLRQMSGSHYIVKLIDVICPDNIIYFKDFFIVLEFCAYDLKSFIKFHLQNHKAVSVDVIRFTMFEILHGLKVCKDNQIIHRDLKPANILILDVQGQMGVKICDFGLARDLTQGTQVKKEWIDTRPVKLKKKIIPQQTKIVWVKKTDCQQMSVSSKQKDNVHEYKGSQEGVMLVKEDTSNSRADKAYALKKERRLTRHLVTRWYRPPEIILLQNYDYKVDIWSAGCIFTELLGLTIGANLHGPLFPGKSCYPMSPVKRPSFDKDGHQTSQDMTMFDAYDQLNIIFNIIGTPREEQLDYLVRDDIRQYVKNFGEIRGVSFDQLYPNAGQEAIDLLANMLRFNPEERYSVEQCLQHRFFSSLKINEKVENWDVSLDFENAGFHLCSNDIRALLMREVNYFHRIDKFEVIFGNLLEEITGKKE